MQINRMDLQNKLITDFEYHDAIIIKVTKNVNDVTILLKDGWNEGKIDELNFINCKINHRFDLENREIYQLDDIAYFEKSGWHMSFLIWTDEGLLEKVIIESENIIAKKYEIKENLFQPEKDFKKLMKKIKKQIGECESTCEKLQDQEIQKLFDDALKKRETLLFDINNYKFTQKEDLNKEMYINK